MVIKGLRQVIEKSAEVAELASQNRVQYLYLGDGDTALIRFVDDSEMVQTKIHEYEEMTPGGKKYRKAYCVKDLKGTECKWDAIANVPKGVYVFLVYVYNIIHKTQNPKLNTDDKAAKWEPVKVGTQTLYKENVEAIRIYRMKFGKDGYLKTAILNLSEEYGTLCDRDYKIVRTGKDKTTLYSFIPKDPSEAPEKIAEAMKEVPSLVDILVPGKTESTKKEEEAVADGEEASKEEVEEVSLKAEPVQSKPKAGRPAKKKEHEETEEDLF